MDTKGRSTLLLCLMASLWLGGAVQALAWAGDTALQARVEAEFQRQMGLWWQEEGRPVREMGGQLEPPSPAVECRALWGGASDGYFSYLLSVEVSCRIHCLGRGFQAAAVGVGPSRTAALQDGAVKVARIMVDRMGDELWRRAADLAMARMQQRLTALDTWMKELTGGEALVMGVPIPGDEEGGGQ